MSRDRPGGGRDRVRNMAFVTAALDFGGTKLVFALVDEHGRILAKVVEPRAGRNPAEVIAWARARQLEMCANLGITAVNNIGSTVPAYVDAGKEIMEFAPAHGWRDIPFAQMLRNAFQVPARIENDVNACAVAERKYGLAKNVENFFWMTVSTGIGGAVVLNGELFAGRGAAGEIGHCVVDENGPRCGCGHRGCLEAVASGPAMAREALAAGLEIADAKDLFARQAELPAAREIIERSSRAMAKALAYAINILDLELIVVGGGVAQALDLQLIHKQIADFTILPAARIAPIVFTGLGQDAALLGAAAIAQLTRPHVLTR
jgi:glucokinase